MKDGFSFLSILVAVVIIGLLLAVLLPQFKQTVQEQHTTQINALQSAQQVQQQLDAQQKIREDMFRKLEGN